MRLTYWLKASLVEIAAIIGGSGVYTLLMSFSVHAAPEEGPLFLFLIYMIGFGGFMALILNAAAYMQQLPLAIAFGSSRKEAMVGMQLYRLLPGLVTALAAAVIVLIRGNAQSPGAFLVALVSLFLNLILGTWGSFMGMAGARLGNKATIAVLVIGLVILAGGAAMIIPAAINPNSDAIFDALFSNPSFPWVMGLVPAALYGISLIPEKKAIYAYSVKL